MPALGTTLSREEVIVAPALEDMGSFRHSRGRLADQFWFRGGPSSGQVNCADVDCKVFEVGTWSRLKFTECGGEIDGAIIVPKELLPLDMGHQDKLSTHILIKANLIEIDRI